MLNELTPERKKYLKEKKKKRERLHKMAEGVRRAAIFNMRPAEAMFAALLKLNYVNYEAQYIVYNDWTYYLLDFYIPEFNVAIEIDGEHHIDQQIADNIRQKYCEEKRGMKFYRFDNQDVFNKLPEVFEKVKDTFCFTNNNLTQQTENEVIELMREDNLLSTY